jgi:hypothetical protein
MAALHALLLEFAEDRLGLVERHEASARIVSHYDFNNAYQYVINREETHLEWVKSALADAAATPVLVSAAALPVPVAPPGKKTVDVSAYRAILEDDARYLAAFVEKWRPRVDRLSHARHRTMLGVVLGESMEHTRFFELAAAGVENLLGRRTAGSARVGGVLPTRWQE